MFALKCNGKEIRGCLSLPSPHPFSLKAVGFFHIVSKLRFFFLLKFDEDTFHQWGIGFNMVAFYRRQTGASLFPSHACCFGELVTNRYQRTDGSFSFLLPPAVDAVFLAVQQRDLHKPELLIASLRGARLDSASHPFCCGKKKRRNLRKSGKKDFCLCLISPVEFVKQKEIL